MDRTLVFLHGWASGPDIWQKQREYFKQYNVIARQLRSDNLESIAEDIYSVCRKIENLIIIGWSMGWLAALKLPEYKDLDIKGMISICGTPKFISDDYVFGGIGLNELRALRAALKKDFTTALNNFYSQHDIPQRAEPRISNKDLYIKQLEILEKEDLRSNLSLINCPALFIAARNDILCPVAVQEYMSSHVKNSQLEVIEDTTHAPFWDKETEVNDLIEEFIM